MFHSLSCENNCDRISVIDLVDRDQFLCWDDSNRSFSVHLGNNEDPNLKRRKCWEILCRFSHVIRFNVCKKSFCSELFSTFFRLFPEIGAKVRWIKLFKIWFEALRSSWQSANSVKPLYFGRWLTQPSGRWFLGFLHGARVFLCCQLFLFPLSCFFPYPLLRLTEMCFMSVFVRTSRPLTSYRWVIKTHIPKRFLTSGLVANSVVKSLCARNLNFFISRASVYTIHSITDSGFLFWYLFLLDKNHSGKKLSFWW